MSDFLNRRPPSRADFRAQVQGGTVILPGAYDAMSARLVEEAGFDGCYVSGFGVSASLLGRPDVGLVTGTEMLDAVRRICQATSQPVIADADTGFGNEINVVRTVKDYEQAGVAGIQLEDQVYPKRCGHMAGKAVIDRSDAVAKIRAAAAARTDPDLLVVARTDALAVNGVDDAIDRAKAFADAGADVLFVEAPRTEADIELVATRLAGYPLLFNWVEGGQTEVLSVDLVRRLGYNVVIFPISTLLTAMHGVRSMLAGLRATRSTAGSASVMATFDGVTELLGLDRMRDLETEFRTP
ncbi:isocitrate lyase/PEP mutase family protein [Cumulibacter manganitolerans]|uniref:isocitrate lyase/PEP mutase family protein n=1 Tax=Cumulibacter manganitolerans TaxID=1884992 RepID=UPI001297776E|nr:isocitrate lyase/PEP mutase family protein [Cumulibacter manganitolerans]